MLWDYAAPTPTPCLRSLTLSGVRFRHYLPGTLLGLPLPIAVYCIFFDALAKAWAGA